MKNKVFRFLITSLAVVTLSSCNWFNKNKGEEEVTKPESKGSKISYNYATYNNNDYNDYVFNGASKVANQWEDHGLSSPFILRHNGVYYLYSSTTPNSNESGVRAWTSTDLVNWVPVETVGLKKGYVVATTVGETLKARAPEVYYYNGQFYMYESYNDGAGHFILRSDSPAGPFTSVTKAAIDEKYDGTLVFDKNENPYFVTAGKNNLNVSTMEGMESIINTDLKVNGTDRYPDMYAQSPAVFDYMGKYYLLYSSSYEKTDGYQVSYAVSDGWTDYTPSGFASSFRRGADSTLLINADKDEGFTGLGHPSVVLGPDLDSYYLAYDSIDNIKNNLHSFGLDRLLISGDTLTTKHQRFSSLAPTRPAFETSDESGLVASGDYLLSAEGTQDAFSVEYNFKDAQHSELIFAYHDENNYSYMKVDMLRALSIYQKVNGADTLVAKEDFFNYLSNDVLHTVRIGYRDQKLDVHFENSLKFSGVDINLSGGKVGYKKGENLEVGYTSFSNVARGLSNQNAIKNAECEIPAALHLSANAVEGASSYGFSEGSGVSNSEMKLAKKYDYARYLLSFNNDATYGLELSLNKDNFGKKVIIEIDDEEDIEVEIPTLTNLKGDTTKVLVGDIAISKGIHQVKIQNASDSLSYSSFKFVKRSAKNYSLFAALNNEQNIRGLSFKGDGSWNFINDQLVSYDNYRNIVLTKEKNLSNFNMSVDMNLTGSDSIFSESSQSGIIFRASNYVSYEDYMVDHSDITMWNNRKYDVQGFYLSFTSRKAVLYKLDNGINKMEAIETVSSSLGSKKKHNLTLKVNNNQIDLFVDGKFNHTFYVDNSFTSGAVGLYATGAEVAYSNFAIEGK